MPEAGWERQSFEIAGPLLDQRAAIGKIRNVDLAEGLSVLLDLAIGGNNPSVPEGSTWKCPPETVRTA